MAGAVVRMSWDECGGGQGAVGGCVDHAVYDTPVVAPVAPPRLRGGMRRPEQCGQGGSLTALSAAEPTGAQTRSAAIRTYWKEPSR
ncbi:hypothetical protein SRO_0470 [Streptomyces rochei]|nr:hypothetical protein SRO_0470 [Streptomyces rochei]